MNRRNFLASTFTILAAATTYVRAPWKILPESNVSVPDDELWVPGPDYAEPYEIHFQWEHGEDNLKHSICGVGCIPGPYSPTPHNAYFARFRKILSLRQGETQKITAEFYDAAGYRITQLPQYVSVYDADHPEKFSQ